MNTEPESAVSSAAQQCISVDLPEPLGPITAVNSPGREVEGHVVERDDPRLARCRRSWSGRAPARLPGSLMGPSVCQAAVPSPPLSGIAPRSPRAVKALEHLFDLGVHCRAWTSSATLFERGRRDGPRRCAPLAGAERTTLTRGAWVDVAAPGCSDADDVFAAPGRRRAVAGRAPADVRPRRRRAPAGAHLRRSARSCPTRCLDDGARGALRALPARARRAVRDRRLLLLPRRPRLASPGTATPSAAASTTDTMVAIVSFGDPRRLALRPRWRRRARSSSRWATATWW